MAEFDLLCTVQSDKASVDVTARRAGVVARLAAAVGDIVQVGAPLLEMRVVDGGGEVVAAAASAAAPSPPSPPPHASPAVRRVAKELGVPLAAVAGTGPAGRVVKADVEVAAGRGSGAPAAPPTHHPGPPQANLKENVVTMPVRTKAP